MGRAKLNMELIEKEKSRNITFKKRKEGLIRKLHEFTTLCDVNACMIIYGPKQESNSAVKPDIWPQNLNQVRRVIGDYKSKNKDSGNKTVGLSDFFQERKRRIEEELTRLRRKNMEAKYPTWLELLDFKTEEQLRQFAAALSNKAEYVKLRIELLRRSSNKYLMDFADHARLSGNGNIHCASFNGEVISESLSTVDPMVSSYQMPMACYNALQPPLPYMVEPPQLHFSTGWEKHEGSHDLDMVQMEMLEAQCWDWTY